MTKTCSCCKKEKPLEEFNKETRNRDGLCYYCKPCIREIGRASYKLHREKRYKKHQEWIANNSERYKELQAAWYERNKEEHLKKSKENYKKNKERKYKKGQEWIRKNPERAREMWQRRRTREANSEGDFTAKEWIALCEKYNQSCLVCGEKKKLTVDHVIPLALGGRNDIENIQPLCQSCNTRKHTKIIDYRISWSLP